MRRPEQHNRPLLLLGFSAAGETLPYLATSLSNERVDYVANRLTERGIDPARSRGMGGTAPVASNDSLLGKQRNRRVEVWLGPAGQLAGPTGPSGSNAGVR
jgi:phosphate transport system substrate-binding protein